MISDRGSQFTSHLWAEFTRLLGISPKQTTAYHPQANGMVERFHRQLKASIMASSSASDWMSSLPLVLLGIRSAWRTDLGCSPAELTFGAPLHLAGEFVEVSLANFPDHDFLANLKEQMNSLVPVQTLTQTTRVSRVPPELADAAYVYVRRDARAPPLNRPYQGPYRVITAGDKFFELDMKNRIDRVSIDRLKRARVDDSLSEKQQQNNNSESSLRAEDPSVIAAQPLLQNRRGRPSRAMLEERARLRELADAEREMRITTAPTVRTRSGREICPPDRL